MGRLGSLGRCFGACVLMMGMAGCKPSGESPQSAADHPAPPVKESKNSASSDWAREEVLTQLTELRKELADARADIRQLNDKIDKLPVNAAPVAAARPVAPAAPKERPLNDRFGLGKEAASVAIVEYTDFQCPYCARHFKEVLPDIRKNYVDTGKIRYFVRTYPLGFHDQAKGASIAALCAGEQGQYWSMHDFLFEHARELKRELYIQQAADLKLKSQTFATCLDNPDSAKSVESTLAEADVLGVSGTPKFFLGHIANGKLTDITVIGGAQSYPAFSAALDALLKK